MKKIYQSVRSKLRKWYNFDHPERPWMENDKFHQSEKNTLANNFSESLVLRMIGTDFVCALSMFAALILSLIVPDWAYLISILLTVCFLAFLYGLGLYLAWPRTRREYHCLKLLVIFYAVTLIALTLVYRQAGLQTPGGTVDHSLVASLYFSVVTFTTLGYGDLIAPSHIRLVAAFEACSV